MQASTASSQRLSATAVKQTARQPQHVTPEGSRKDNHQYTRTLNRELQSRSISRAAEHMAQSALHYRRRTCSGLVRPIDMQSPHRITTPIIEQQRHRGGNTPLSRNGGDQKLRCRLHPRQATSQSRVAHGSVVLAVLGDSALAVLCRDCQWIRLATSES